MTSQIEPQSRVFLDANVLYAAASGGGRAKLWQVRSIQLVTSEYAAQEAYFNLRGEVNADECRTCLESLLQPPLELIQTMETLGCIARGS